MMSIQQIAAQALATHQLSDWAEWRIGQLLSRQQHTPADLVVLDRLLEALEDGRVVVVYAEPLAS